MNSVKKNTHFFLLNVFLIINNNIMNSFTRKSQQQIKILKKYQQNYEKRNNKTKFLKHKIWQKYIQIKQELLIIFPLVCIRTRFLFYLVIMERVKHLLLACLLECKNLQKERPQFLTKMYKLTWWKLENSWVFALNMIFYMMI